MQKGMCAMSCDESIYTCLVGAHGYLDKKKVVHVHIYTIYKGAYVCEHMYISIMVHREYKTTQLPFH